MSPAISTLRDLAASARGRRQSLGLSQAQVADRARVSRQWVNEFELGKPTAEVALVLRVLAALDLTLTLDVPGRADKEAPEDAVDLDALLDEYRSP